jgi:hypothetical protein
VAGYLTTKSSLFEVPYNKIGALKTAAQNLVTQLSGLAKNNGDVYISVVPFEIDVNVGNSTTNLNASWLRWDLWDPNGSCTGSYINATVMSYAACVGHNFNWHHIGGTANHNQWNGCVGDRDQSNDINAIAPSSQPTNFVADQDTSCPAAPILPLTYNWTAVNNTINAMTAQGATNQTIGLQWGWLSLLQQSPLNAPAEPTTTGATYQHTIILFTDGLNTGDRWYGDLSDTSSQVDTRMTREWRPCALMPRQPASPSIPCRSTPMAPGNPRCFLPAPAARAISLC